MKHPNACVLAMAGLLSVLLLAAVAAGDAELTRTIHTSQGLTATVQDEFLHPHHLKTFRMLMRNYGGWRFEPLRGNLSSTILDPSSTERWRFQNGRWWARVPTEPFCKTSMWKRGIQGALRAAAVEILGTAGDATWDVCHAAVSASRSSDPGRSWLPQGDLIGGELPLLHSTVFLLEQWEENGYGEYLLYGSGPDREVEAMVRPSYGRMVTSHGSIRVGTRPPGAPFRKVQLMLHLTACRSDDPRLALARREEVAEAAEEEARLERVTRNLAISAPHWREEAPASLAGVKERIIEVPPAANTPEGARIRVHDEAWSEEEMDGMRALIEASFRSYVLDDHDEAGGDDNVVWMAMLDIDRFVSTKLWSKVLAMVRSGVKDEEHSADDWFPYDIACNLIEPSDHPRIHADCEDDEEERTTVTYFNEEWASGDETWLGETVFFTTTDANYEVFEAFSSVKPRLGRTILFQGKVPHSARSPAPLFGRASMRRTLAVKVSPTERAARAKTLREVVEPMANVAAPVVPATALELIKDKQRAQQVYRQLMDTAVEFLSELDRTAADRQPDLAVPPRARGPLRRATLDVLEALEDQEEAFDADEESGSSEGKGLGSGFGTGEGDLTDWNRRFAKWSSEALWELLQDGSLLDATADRAGRGKWSGRVRQNHAAGAKAGQAAAGAAAAATAAEEEVEAVGRSRPWRGRGDEDDDEGDWEDED